MLAPAHHLPAALHVMMMRWLLAAGDDVNMLRQGGTSRCPADPCCPAGPAGEKHLEAYALFSRALERVSSAEARLGELARPDAQLAGELQQLGSAARAWRCAAHAELAAAGLAAQEGMQEELGGLKLQEGEQLGQQVRAAGCCIVRALRVPCTGAGCCIRPWQDDVVLGAMAVWY